MQGQGQRRGALERASHAGLLCIYTLAAVLGLFLHAQGPDSRPFAHVCGETSPDLDRHDGAPRSEHDEARCGLCHLHARLALALPAAAPAAAVPPPPTSSAEPARSARARSAFVHTPPSRGPPRTSAV